MEPYAAADQVWAAGLIFARVGAIIMLIPGIGDAYVPPRIRLSLALVVSLALAPVVVATLPPLPASAGLMAGWMIREVVTGLMIGALLRMLLSAMPIAGEIVSMQSTLGFSQTANPLHAQPGTSLSAFLTLLGVTLIFATDAHHLFIAGMVGSYEAIPPVPPLLMQDFSTLAVRTVGESFTLGVQLAAPVLVFAIIFNLTSGLVGRVMPQFQVFFAAAPLNVILGLSVFTLSLGVIGTVFLAHFRRGAGLFLGAPDG